MPRDGSVAAPAPLAGTWSAFATEQWSAGEISVDVDQVIEETPVALVYNGISHAVMLASPSELEDFALGFSLTEEIIETASDVHDIEVVAGPQGIEVQLTIAAGRMASLRERRRALLGRTGCGLCGVETLAQVVHPPASVHGQGRLTAEALDTALGRLTGQQTLHGATGAAHAAAFATWNGDLRLLREDVGRHNALDKMIGAMIRSRGDPSEGFALVTSRASYEMVHKTAAAGISLLAALSAPTAMAIRTADTAGLTLVGFAARGRRQVYAHSSRFTGPVRPFGPRRTWQRST